MRAGSSTLSAPTLTDAATPICGICSSDVGKVPEAESFWPAGKRAENGSTMDTPAGAAEGNEGHNTGCVFSGRAWPVEEAAVWKRSVDNGGRWDSGESWLTILLRQFLTLPGNVAAHVAVAAAPTPPAEATTTQSSQAVLHDVPRPSRHSKPVLPVNRTHGPTVCYASGFATACTKRLAVPSGRRPCWRRRVGERRGLTTLFGQEHAPAVSRRLVLPTRRPGTSGDGKRQKNSAQCSQEEHAGQLTVSAKLRHVREYNTKTTTTRRTSERTCGHATSSASCRPSCHASCCASCPSPHRNDASNDQATSTGAKASETCASPSPATPGGPASASPPPPSGE